MLQWRVLTVGVLTAIAAVAGYVEAIFDAGFTW